MSARASYVLIEGGKPALYSSRWGAATVARDLAPGPEAGIAFVRGQAPADALYEDGWCEGGAVLDIDRRVLLFFGSADHLGDIWDQRAFLGQIARSWPGWTVRWAYEGVADFAKYIGAPIEMSREPGGRPTWACPHAVAATVVSVREHRNANEPLRLYVLHPIFEELVAGGSEALLDVLRTLDRDGRDAERLIWTDPSAGGPTRSTFDVATKTWHGRPGVPRAGLHLELDRREAHYWSAWPTTVRHWAPAHWSGWTWHSWNDRFEEQLAIAGGRISIEMPTS